MKKKTLGVVMLTACALLAGFTLQAAPDTPTALVDNGVLPRSVGAACTDSYIAGTTLSSAAMVAEGATHYSIEDVDYTEPKGAIVLNSSFTEGFVNGGFHDVKSDVYAIVSNPRVLNEKFDQLTDGVNRLVLGVGADPYGGAAKVLMTYTVSGLKAGSSVKLTFDVEDITSSVYCGCIGGDYMQIVVKGISGKRSTLNFIECGSLYGHAKASAELVFDNVETGFVSFSIEASQLPVGKVLAFSNFKVYGCLERNIETDLLGNSAYEGDIVEFTANGFDDLTGPYTWYSSTDGVNYEVIAGETGVSVKQMIMLGKNYIKVSRDGESRTCEIIGMVKCSLEGEEQYVLFKEDFEKAAHRRADNSGCICGYKYASEGKVDDDYYCIVSNMSQASPEACGWPRKATDHTGDISGGFLILNCGNNPNKCFYKRNIGKICANVWYDFSLFAANVAVAPNMPGEFRFEVREAGTVNILNSCETGYIKDMAVDGEPLKWNKYGFSFISDRDVELELRLYTTGTETQGNDVAIDDMMLTVCQTYIGLFADRNNQLFDADFNCGETVPMGLVTEGDIERIYTNPYFLWQISNNQKTWSTLVEGGMEVLTYDYVKECDRAKYVRVICAGSKEDTYKVAAGEELDECDSYVMSNVAFIGCPDCPEPALDADYTRSCNRISLTGYGDEPDNMRWLSSTDGVTWTETDLTGAEVVTDITCDTYFKVTSEDASGVIIESSEVFVEFEKIELKLSESYIGVGYALEAEVSFTGIDPTTDVKWYVDGVLVGEAPSPYPIEGILLDSKISASADGCESQGAIEVKWPTVFMPESESNTDFVTNLNISLRVYDRYGDMVVESEDGWDGTINGKPASPGVYYYVATVPSGAQKKGSVELFKR